MAGLDPAARSLRGRIGAYRLHATHDARVTSAPGRAAFLARFEREINPDGSLPAPERAWQPSGSDGPLRPPSLPWRAGRDGRRRRPGVDWMEHSSSPWVSERRPGSRRLNMAGPGSDPRLLGAAWANEARLAEEQTDTGQARQHRAEDYEAAKAREQEAARSSGSRHRFIAYIEALLHRGW